MSDHKARLKQLQDEIAQREQEAEIIEQLLEAEDGVADAKTRLAKMNKGGGE